MLSPMSLDLTADIGTLLGVWAHPDDEAYLSSALMASVRRHGGRVVVATATRGEHGTPDPETWPPERLAEVRERELMESLAHIDVQEHEWLGHRDGALADVPFEAGVGQVSALLERVRPDTVVTFGPDGMTGHPDHQTVSAWVTEAWRRAGARGALWYATTTPEFQERWDELHQRLDIWFDGMIPPVTAASDLALQLVCDEDLLDLKHRVLRAHASQTAALEEMLGTAVFRDWWSTEYFVAAPPGTARQGTSSA
jgi:LmbE family N-acetylglucosaminyl deacetylase